MKRVFLVVLLFVHVLVFAQNNNVQNAWNYRRSKELDKAKVAIDAAAVHEDTKSKPKMFLYRAQVYVDILQTKDEHFKNLDPDAAEKAFAAVINCYKADKDKTFADDLKLLLEQTSLYMYNKALALRDSKQYDKAVEDAKMLFDALPYDKEDALKHHNISGDKLDYLIYSLAIQAKNNTLAKEYINKLIDLNYREPLIYQDMADIYLAERDTAKALSYVEQGIKRFGDNESLIAQETEIYIKSNRSNELLEKLKAEVEGSPENPILFYNEGYLLKQKGDFSNAEIAFKKAIDLNPSYTEAYHSLGVLYLNKGVELANMANDLPPKESKKAAELTQKSDEYLKLAIPCLEKVHENSPKNEVVKRNLMQLYTRTGQVDKYQKLKDEVVK